MSTQTSGHVGLLDPCQRVLDGEQAAGQAVSDDSLSSEEGRSGAMSIRVRTGVVQRRPRTMVMSDAGMSS